MTLVKLLCENDQTSLRGDKDFDPVVVFVLNSLNTVME